MFHVKYCSHLLTPLPPRTARRPNAPRLDAETRQPRRRIVGTQAQAVLGARGEHTIGLGNTLQGQIIDHHGNVAVRTIQPGCLPAERRRGRLKPGNQTLRRRLFVTGRSVDLPGTVEPGDGPNLQVGRQCAGINMVVLHRIARLHDHRTPAARHGPHHFFLHIDRQRGADTVGVDEMRIQPLGLEEHLMPLAITETMDLVFDRRAVARPCSGNRAREQRRAMKVRADRIVARLCRTGDTAEHLRIDAALGKRRHGPGLAIGRLLFEHRPVDGAPV